MYKRIYILAVFVLGMFTAIAQHEGDKQGKNPEEKAKRELRKLAVSLELTPEQAAVLKPLTEKKFEQIKALKAKKTEENKKDVRQAIKSLQEEWVKDVKTNLNLVQTQKFDLWLAEKKAEREKKKAEKNK